VYAADSSAFDSISLGDMFQVSRMAVKVLAEVNNLIW
jgi:hypothetical protein